MRLGGWSSSCGSFVRCVAAMNSRGTLRSTQRSFRQDEITQIVAQVSNSHGGWTAGVAREVCRRAIEDEGVIDHGAIATINMAHVQKLCSLMCECVLTLRNGTIAALASDGEQYSRAALGVCGTGGGRRRLPRRNHRLQAGASALLAQLNATS